MVDKLILRLGEQFLSLLLEETAQVNSHQPFHIAVPDVALITSFPMQHLYSDLSFVLQFLSESNVDYQVIGILGGPAVGKSTILNALYGLAADHPSIAASRTPPPFPVQSDETRMLARHSSSGVEMRLTAERLILLDSQVLDIWHASFCHLCFAVRICESLLKFR
jgi:hypothetical protein